MEHRVVLEKFYFLELIRSLRQLAKAIADEVVAERPIYHRNKKRMLFITVP